MRSRTTRLTFGAVALIAIGAATVLLARSERHISILSSSVRAFDRHARETTDAIAELRIGQQAYVAAGQGAAFWMPRVAAAIEQVTVAIGSLRRAARSAPGHQALMEAEATVKELGATEKRIREYLSSGDHLMAADVIFTEGGDAAAAAARQVEMARLAEQQAFDATEGRLRRQQATTLAATAVVVVTIMLWLVPVRHPKPSRPVEEWARPSQPVAAAIEASHPPPPVSTFPGIAAELCTAFGRVRDVDDLKRMLARAADSMDANGLVVWLERPGGAVLQPVVAHGYSPQVVARMPAVSRSANNAAAAAYRTGLQQIVPSTPGTASGAIVAPILAPDGCIGALSAEIRAGSERSEGIQALVTIVAAQLAGLFAATASSAHPLPRQSAQA
jgi:hypothetical protein